MRRDSFFDCVSQGTKNSSTIAETTQPSSKRTMKHYKCSTGVLTMRFLFFLSHFGGEVNAGAT